MLVICPAGCLHRDRDLLQLLEIALKVACRRGHSAAKFAGLTHYCGYEGRSQCQKMLMQCKSTFPCMCSHSILSMLYGNPQCT